MSATRPQVSVVMPLYNKERYVERALRSVSGQTWGDLEVVVVDDGSTDGGARLVREYGDARVRLVAQENRGPGFARARGMQEALGEDIAFLDADDEWTAGFVTSARALLADFPTAGAAGMGYARCGRDGTMAPATVNTIPHDREWRGIVPDFFRASLGYPPLCSSATMVRSRVIKELRPLASAGRRGEDQYLWCQIAARYPIAFDNRVMAYYHQEGEGRISTRWPYDGELPSIAFLLDGLRDGSLRGARPSSVAAFIARNQLATIRCICGRGGDLVLARTLYARTPCVPRYMGEWARVGLLLMLGRRTALRGRR